MRAEIRCSDRARLAETLCAWLCSECLDYWGGLVCSAPRGRVGLCPHVAAEEMCVEHSLRAGSMLPSASVP